MMLFFGDVLVKMSFDILLDKHIDLILSIIYVMGGSKIFISIKVVQQKNFVSKQVTG